MASSVSTALVAPTSSRLRARVARRRSSAVKPTRASANSGDNDEQDKVPLATTIGKKFGVALAASALLAAPSTASPSAFYPAPVVSDVAALSPNPVTNARALLRNSLPVNNKEIREVQKRLEAISDDLRVPGRGLLSSTSQLNLSRF
jgi:hypothetical protein